MYFTFRQKVKGTCVLYMDPFLERMGILFIDTSFTINARYASCVSRIYALKKPKRLILCLVQPALRTPIEILDRKSFIKE